MLRRPRETPIAARWAVSLVGHLYHLYRPDISPAERAFHATACGGSCKDTRHDRLPSLSLRHRTFVRDARGEDFIGTYQVTSHRENHQQGSPIPCSDPGPEVQPDDRSYAAYFALAIDSFFDDPDFLVFQTCDGPGVGCVDTSIQLDVVEGGLESTSANTQEGDASCNLYAGRSSLTLDGAIATLEDRRWSNFDHPASDCTLAAAEALIGTPECQDVAVWVGTRSEN